MVAVLVAPAVLTAEVKSVPKSGDGPVHIEIHAGKHAGYTIPRTIFGSFLEPIGNSTYNGLWAEILQNPSFEENLWSARQIERMVQEQPPLARSSQLGLPLPWEPLHYEQGNRYEPRWGDAANSWRSLDILGLPDAETGVRQQVFLPVHRELHYKGSIYVKHLSGPAEIDLSLRRRDHPEDVLCRQKTTAASTEWKKYEFTLDIPPGRLMPLEPADFVIEVSGGERALVDQVSLMPLDAISGMDPDEVAMAKQMKTPLVRFGGNFTSGYHWRDGIGPRDKRVSMLNIAWGIPEYNQFGTDEFLEFCRLIGAEPQIALNLGSGTPQEAADWVKYVDEHEKRNGFLWELGNELWGNWNLGYPTLRELPDRTTEFSKAVRSVDPRARLIATGQDPDVYQKWNAAQLTAPPATFDYLSTHFVVTTDRTQDHRNDPGELAEQAFALPVELGRKLHHMQDQIDRSPNFKGKAHIAFTEWLWVCCRDEANADAPRFDNMGGALTTAGFFNMLIENADVVPISDMTGIMEFAGIWKKRGRVYASPAYYVFQMYSTADAYVPVGVQSDVGHYEVHHGITRLPEIPDVPYLDIVGTLNNAGDRLTLFCLNRDLRRDLPASISVDGFQPKGQASVETLSSTSIYDRNDEVRPKAVAPMHATVETGNGPLRYTFRHESITRIELRR
jgi:alpha-N-arabinofuranosidase